MALQIGMVHTQPNSANVLRIVSVLLRDVNKPFTDYLQSATQMVGLHLSSISVCILRDFCNE